MVLFAYSGPLVSFPETLLKVLPSQIAENLVPNAGFFIGFVLYSLYYMYLGDYVVAIPYNAFLFVLTLSANHFFAAVGPASAWKYALAAHILGWVMQIAVGHSILEGRKAALLDSLFDALFMAPLFTWYEMLFFFGFRKEFKKKLQQRIDARIMEMDSNKKATKSL